MGFDSPPGDRGSGDEFDPANEERGHDPNPIGHIYQQLTKVTQYTGAKESPTQTVLMRRTTAADLAYLAFASWRRAGAGCLSCKVEERAVGGGHRTAVTVGGTVMWTGLAIAQYPTSRTRSVTLLDIDTAQIRKPRWATHMRNLCDRWVNSARSQCDAQ